GGARYRFSRRVRAGRIRDIHCEKPAVGNSRASVWSAGDAWCPRCRVHRTAPQMLAALQSSTTGTQDFGTTVAAEKSLHWMVAKSCFRFGLLVSADPGAGKRTRD